VLRVAALRARGFGQREIADRVKPLQRVAVGAYVERSARTAEEDHLVRAVGLLTRLSDVACSHVTAAVGFGLPVPRSALEVVQFSPLAGRRGHPKAGPGYWLHAQPVDPDDLHPDPGVALRTSALRTVLDCARSLEGDWAVVVGDSALRRGLVTVEDLQARAARVRGLRGAGRARALPGLCSPLAESPGESLLRLRLHRMGLVVHEQVELTAGGRRWRVDFLVQGCVIVEFDGRLKYASEGRGAQALWDEKLRHDMLVEEGHEVVRVVWDQLWDEATLRLRVDRALQRARQRGLPGRCPP
jgi:very-short-patch-repair endonuclease